MRHNLPKFEPKTDGPWGKGVAQMKLVYVEFRDHGSTAAWHDTAGIDLEQGWSDAKLRAVGWVLAENERTLCLGSFVSDDLTRSHTRQYIVKAAITKRRTLKAPQ